MPVISIRVSEEWIAAVEAEGKQRLWKRNAAIVNLVWQAIEGKARQLLEHSGPDGQPIKTEAQTRMVLVFPKDGNASPD